VADAQAEQDAPERPPSLLDSMWFRMFWALLSAMRSCAVSSNLTSGTLRGLTSG
jgi:hypothetical protein